MRERIVYPTLIICLLSATCAPRGGDDVVETTTRALTVLTFEAETLARTASAAGSQVTSEAGASAGQYVQLSGTPPVNSWIEFTLPNVAAGTYDLKVLYKANTNRGIVQASVDGANQGAACDQFATAAAQQVACSAGSKTLSAGNHTIRFTVTGKNASSTGFMMVIDQISLTASAGGGSGATFEAETLARTASAAGSQVTSEAGASGGQYVQLSGTPPVNSWIEFTLPNVAAGTYDVRLLYKANTNRGVVQASIDGAPQGPACDQFATAAAQQIACSLGSKTLTTTGNRTMRFTVTGKNASSGGFMMVIDQISLTPSGGGGTSVWVGTWAGAPQLTETANLPPASLTNATLRQVVHVSVGGSQLRVKFSNEFGNGAVTINAAHVAVCNANPVNSTIDTATDRALTFSGSASVTIAQGQAKWSDPINFALAPLSNLAVTVAFGGTPTNVTGHPGSRTTSYLQSASSNVSGANMSSALTADHWYILSGVDTFADAKAIAILGDSITDGRGSTTNGNDRWPDDLARRLQSSGATKVAVVNAGIGGNALASGGIGPTGLSRFSRDILGQSAVRWVIVFEGVNDIGADVSAATITSAYDTLIAQARGQGLRVYGATVTPFGGNSYNTPAHEAVRQSVNTYIRSGKFDAFIDFDAAVRDTSSPPRVQTQYDSGDGLHLNPAGYQKLADTVNLTLFAQ
ncbi:MAG TPA: GDSL-type esterase/lipase family protein [Polyangia bacterium]|nr:GDSL-type esterase/lipase family protein [Polyangia bacterium]